MSTKLFTLGLRAAAVRHSGEEGSGMAAEKKALAPGLYASPFSKAYWRDAAVSSARSACSPSRPSSSPSAWR